jgi:hypothetical protein
MQTPTILSGLKTAYIGKTISVYQSQVNPEYFDLYNGNADKVLTSRVVTDVRYNPADSDPYEPMFDSSYSLIFEDGEVILND